MLTQAEIDQTRRALRTRIVDALDALVAFEREEALYQEYSPGEWAGDVSIWRNAHEATLEAIVRETLGVRA